MKAKLHRQTKDKITWLSPVGYRQSETYCSVDTTEYCLMYQQGNIVVNKDADDKLLYAGKACSETDKRFNSSYSSSSVHNYNGGWGAGFGLTFDKMIQWIVEEIEPYFPGETLEVRTSYYYLATDETPRINPGFKYKCDDVGRERKYNINKPSFLQMSEYEDLNEFISWFRANGFNVEVVDDMYSNNEDKTTINCYGHDLFIRLSTKLSGRSISYGDFLQYEHIGRFAKISRMEQLPRPTSIDELSQQVYSLIQSKFKEDEPATNGNDLHSMGQETT